MTSLPIIGILSEIKAPPSVPSLERPPSMGGRATSPEKNRSIGEPMVEEMVKIPSGKFIRGSNSGGFNEGPENVMFLSAFWIDKYEVTNHQYMEFVKAAKHRKPGPPARYAKKLAQLRGANQPGTYVSWDDATAYCQWKGARLPSEAEWEKAMRGTDGRLWPWGDGTSGFPANWGGEDDGFEYTAPVGSFPRDQSIFGVFDGGGNLMEWVDDWYVEEAYQLSGDRHRTGLRGGTYKTLRGGGYTSRGIDLRITNRSFIVPDFRDETIGFRCVKS